MQKFDTTKKELTHNQLHAVCNFGILAALVFVECLTEALQVRSRFETAKITS